MSWDDTFEDVFARREKRETRAERKRRAQKDRSKFKKSNLDQKKRHQPTIIDTDLPLLRGRVLAIRADSILVDSEEKIFRCIIQGKMKKEHSRIKNLVAVGDFVHFHPEGHDNGIIALIEERRSVLSRAAHLDRQKEQLIAVNVDQVLITLSVVQPPLKLGIIDRYVIAALKGHMKPVLIINKIDLLESHDDPMLIAEQKALLKEIVAAYKALTIPVLPISTVTGEGLDELKKLMRGKASVFSGQSGTGKTSLINQLIGTNLPTKEVVSKTSKGKHTTTNAQLLKLECGGYCVDTPGIKSFSLWDLKEQDIQNFFSEIREVAQRCAFPDCQHQVETGCAVIKAVKRGKISRLRFDSYCALMASLKDEHRRR